MVNFLDDSPKDGLNLNPDIDSFEIPSDQYSKILNGMFMSFFGKNKSCDSEAKTDAYCRAILKQCSTCFKPDNTLWRNIPGKGAVDWYEKLSLRLKTFGYDISTNSLIGKRESKISEKIKARAKPKSSEEETNQRSFSVRESAAFDEFIEKFRADFVGSTTVADELMIRRLAFLSVLNERDIELVSLSRDLTKEIKDLAESLGVSGKQRKTAFDSDGDGSLQLLSTKFKKTLSEHLEVERFWKLEETKMVLNALKRGTLEEFLAMSWFHTLHGKYILDGSPLTLEYIKKFIADSEIA